MAAELYNYESDDGQIFQGLPLVEVLKLKQADEDKKTKSDSLAAIPAKSQAFAGSLRQAAGPIKEPAYVTPQNDTLNFEQASALPPEQRNTLESIQRPTGQFRNPQLASAADIVDKNQLTPESSTDKNFGGTVLEFLQKEQETAGKRAELAGKIFSDAQGKVSMKRTDGGQGGMTANDILSGNQIEYGTNRLPPPVNRQEITTIRKGDGSPSSVKPQSFSTLLTAYGNLKLTSDPNDEEDNAILMATKKMLAAAARREGVDYSPGEPKPAAGGPVKVASAQSKVVNGATYTKGADGLWHRQ